MGLLQRLSMTVDHARPCFAALLLGEGLFFAGRMDGAPCPVLLSMLPAPTLVSINEVVCLVDPSLILGPS